ncbi:MaoC family dehydratase, partial [Streptomyces sp. CWNU-1]|nr:MaoC family dehydratase [Streptomyces sp. CWNU-1]
DGTVVCVFRRKVMVPNETYIKERGGEQPGRPEPATPAVKPAAAAEKTEK